MAEDDDDDLGPADEDDDRLASLSGRFGELRAVYAILLEEAHDVRAQVAGMRGDLVRRAAWTPWRGAYQPATL